MDVGHQPDDRLRGPLLGLLRRRPRRSAQRRTARGRRFNDLDTGQITGGIYSWYDGKSEKTAFSGKVTQFADNFLGGSHDFKFGVQYNSGLGEYTYGPNDYIYTYGVDAGVRLHAAAVSRRAAACRRWASSSTTPTRSAAATLNLGLRYDDSKAYFAAQDLLDANGNADRRSSRRPWTRSSAGACSRRASAST